MTSAAKAVIQDMPTTQDAATTAPRVSIEVFPPSEPSAEHSLWETVATLEPLQPTFVSVTYGAAGSSRERTHQCVTELKSRIGTPVAPHITCAGVDRTTLRELLHAYWRAGVRQVVALRGDGLNGDRFVPHPQGPTSAIELVEMVCSVAPFDVSVAAYPETHPEAASSEADLVHLQRKLDAGAARALTQFFFEADVFLRFRDRCVARGIRQIIVPGILPIRDLAQTIRFAKRCGAHVPAWVASRFEGVGADPGARKRAAVSISVELIERLRSSGVEEFHLYTLNHAELPRAICAQLGWIKPAESHAI
jgi:methylenetetrahydrofolate reductase (NADPH)